jgi:hypothetical protein
MSSTTASVEQTHGGTHGGPRGSVSGTPHRGGGRRGAASLVPVAQRPAHGNENDGRLIKVISNHFEFGIKPNQGTIYHYDGMSFFFSKTSIE